MGVSRNESLIFLEANPVFTTRCFLRQRAQTGRSTGANQTATSVQKAN